MGYQLQALDFCVALEPHKPGFKSLIPPLINDCVILGK